MKQYDLLIVGNGFDIHLGYRTKYTHFCNYLIRYCQPIHNALLYFFYHAYDYRYLLNDDWTSFEQLLCQYLEFLNYLFVDKNVSFSSERYDNGIGFSYSPCLIVEDINKMPTNCLRILDISNPLEDYVDYYLYDSDNKKIKMETRLSSYQNIGIKLMIKLRKRFFVPPSLDDFKRSVVISLDELLNDSEKQLANYIKSITATSFPKIYFLESHFGDKVGKILSFNYSHSAKEMFSLTDMDVAYVHGDIDNEIVLGIEEEMIEHQTIKESTSMFTPFFKKSRRFIKRCNEHFKNKILDSITVSSEIAIFGHSLDKSDRSIFNQIFSLNFKHCDIFYHGKEADYRIKLIQLIGVERVQELNNSGKISFIEIKGAPNFRG